VLSGGRSVGLSVDDPCAASAHDFTHGAWLESGTLPRAVGCLAGISGVRPRRYGARRNDELAVSLWMWLHFSLRGGYMQHVGIRALRNGLSGWIDRVRQGEEVVITDHGVAVARLVAASKTTRRYDELVAQGVITPASSRSPRRRRAVRV